MHKNLLVLLALVNSFSIHWSSQGNYLVNESGKRTEIQGHPNMICYTGLGNEYGVFQKSKGRKIWLINASRYIEIDYPVCDIKK